MFAEPAFPPAPPARPDRREFLYGLGSTLGTVALSALLAQETPAAQPAVRLPLSPLSPRPGHKPTRARSCIFLFMEGGPSHIDTFDPKPKLRELHLQEFVRRDPLVSAMASGRRHFVQSPFEFRQVGESGTWMCEHFDRLAGVADELCVYRGLVGESINHPTACYHMNTGNRFGGDPAIGAWSSYGLGTANRDLPSFVVLPEASWPQGGAANWASGFLSAHHQGTPLRPTGTPILDLQPPAGVTPGVQKENLGLLKALNLEDRRRHPQERDLSARIDAYELAYRMQSRVPGLIDLGGETRSTLDDYGIGQPLTDSFGRRCLLARKLVEAGVRFVQLFAAGWDSHDYIARSHRSRMQAVDRPIAALIADLKQRGLLDETLVVWAGEFGRTPDNGLRGGTRALGRDHNNEAMTVWLAGGGCRAGHTLGATDEIGMRATELVHPIKNFHVTLLHLLGLDDNRLTYFHEGRYKQLSQTGGEVIGPLVGG